MVLVFDDFKIERRYQQVYDVLIALLIETRAVLGSILPKELDRLKVLKLECGWLWFFLDLMLVAILDLGRFFLLGHRRALNDGRLPQALQLAVDTYPANSVCTALEQQCCRVRIE